MKVLNVAIPSKSGLLSYRKWSGDTKNTKVAIPSKSGLLSYFFREEKYRAAE